MNDVSTGMKYGCLEVLDDGVEYIKVLDVKIENIEEEKADFLESVQKGELVNEGLRDWIGNEWRDSQAFIYHPKNFNSNVDFVRISDFDDYVSKLKKAKEKKHYKCRCRKCGKLRYYTRETLLTEPDVCCKPLYCSATYTYSVKAQNATYKKKQKYANNESVILVPSKDEVIPNEMYCDTWNEKKRKELIKKAQADAETIAAIPRVHAKNYDIDYAGRKYESYDIIECVNGSLESTPTPYYTQQHHKKYRDIIVYKEYRCRCYLCGKERMITCDKFGIYPPTDYGYRAYNGYWSEVYCDCHPISSFQWIVNDILIKNDIDYSVEVEIEGVLGIDEETPLRYDFAVYQNKKIVAFIECQGEQHYMPVEEFGGERRFAIQQRNDETKRKYAIDQGIKLIEISYKNKKYEKVEALLKEQHII